MLDERFMRETMGKLGEAPEPPAPLFSPALKAALDALETDLRDFLRTDRRLSSASKSS